MRNTFHHLPYDGRTVVGSRGEPSAVVREPHVLHLISMLLSSFHAASSACISRRMNPHPPAMWPHLPNGSRALFEVPRKTYGPATTACSLLWLNDHFSTPPRRIITSHMAAIQMPPTSPTSSPTASRYLPDGRGAVLGCRGEPRRVIQKLQKLLLYLRAPTLSPGTSPHLPPIRPYLPDGSHALHTDALSPSAPLRPLITSQMAAVQSLDAEASRVPSLENCRNHTSSACCSSTW